MSEITMALDKSFGCKSDKKVKRLSVSRLK